jgi:catechol 2,3-dioxygenase-like lactoylglutathione lyase family enzyme
MSAGARASQAGGVPAAIVNHVGLTSPDIFATVDWYRSVLGFGLIMGPRVIEPAGASTETGHIFGGRFRKAYQAHLLSANGCGVEVFQFVEPAVESAETEYHYTRRGFTHLCLTVADVDECVERILAGGGERISDVANFVPGRPWQLAYCRDPWGTVLEVMSASYAEVFANWPQPGAQLPTRMLARDGSEYTVDAQALSS